MARFFGKSWKLSLKLFIGIGTICVAPIITLLALSLGHLRTIQDVAVEGTRASMIASQTDLLRDRLKEESTRMSTVFSRIQDETYFIGSMTQNILTLPPNMHARNGSQYVLHKNGEYSSLGNDGNSALYVPHYDPSLDPIIHATESLDFLLKPLSQRESRMVLGWIITRNEISRTYPWSDFSQLPRDKKLTSWPFYYLADQRHNPSKGVVFTPVYLDPLSKEWMVSSLYPVYLKGRHEATVGIDITIQNFVEEMKNVTFTRNSSVLLYSGKEIIAASENLPAVALGIKSSVPFHGQKLDDSRFPEVRKFAASFRYLDQSVKFIETPESRVFMGFATIYPLGWKLVLVIPEEEFIGPAAKSARQILGEMANIRLTYFHIVIASLIGVLIVTVTFVVYQSRGLRSLLNGIRELGNGNLSHRMPEDRTEVGQLSRALNSMAQKLQEKKNELKRAFAEVEQGRKLTAVGRLAAGVAHEVNNPLATISTYAQMIIRRSDLPEDVSDKMQTVLDEIQRIQTQLRNLLDLSRIQSPMKTEVNPNAIVREIAALVRFEANTRGMELTLELCPEERVILADGAGVKQVVWNLLRNALDAQEKGGTIRVRTICTGPGTGTACYLLEVEDSGPGIPEADLPFIFEPFFSTKEVGEGTGLGLSIVFNIVKDHDGNIEAQNLSPNGCRFRVAFPAKEEG